MGYSWVDLLGEFEDIDGGRVFLGREYDGPNAKTDASDKQGEPSVPPVDQPAAPQKKVWVGRSICDQYFKEGVIRAVSERIESVGGFPNRLISRTPSKSLLQAQSLSAQNRRTDRRGPHA